MIGQVFWWGAVADLSPPEEVGAVSGRLQALVRKGLIKPDARSFAGEDAFRFGHILIRDAAYDSMPKRLRAELHERCAAWAEQRGGGGAELDEIIGHHLEQAHALRLALGPGGPLEDALADRAATRLRRAGRRALRRGDIHAARTLLGRAVALLPDRDPRRLELVPELALVLTESGELTRAEELLTSVLEDPRADEAIALAARIERVALRLRSDPRGGWERDLELVEEALPALEQQHEHDAPTHRSLARGWVLVGLVRGLWAGRVAQGEVALERARAHARAAGDRRQEAEIVGRLGFAAWSGPLRRRGGIVRCAPSSRRRRTTSCSRPAAAAGSAASSPATAASRRRGSSSPPRRARTTSWARDWTPPQPRRSATQSVEWLAGDLVAAERALRDGYDALGALGEAGYRATVGALALRVLRAQGRGEAAAELAAWVAEAASEHDLWSQVLHRLTSARVAAASGRHAEAEETAREALAIVEETDLLDLHGDVLARPGRDPAPGRARGGGARERRGCARPLPAQGQRRRRRPRAGPARGRGYEGVMPIRRAVAGSTGRGASGGT